LSRKTSFGVTVNVYATSHAISRRVLNIAIASFELLNSIMEIPLSLNKVDFVILSNYDGGMGNWGHVLLSEDLAISEDEAHLSYVIARELVYQWIGDKSTIDSWQWICLQRIKLTTILEFRVKALHQTAEIQKLDGARSFRGITLSSYCC
ncbi:hypothetical protein DICVIV_13564, partial [Dictyocaulus viviparus]